MSRWQSYLNADPSEWLLAEDDPSVRYWALRTVLDLPEDSAEVREAQKAVMASDPVAKILASQSKDGRWGSEHAFKKYESTGWQVIFLADLGADGADERVRRGCERLLSDIQSTSGGFAYYERRPSSAIHCMNGNVLRALLRLGYVDDERVQSALNWLVSAITGQGDIRYYASGTSGPGFACAANLKQPCAWGAVKGLSALAEVLPERRTPEMRTAIRVGVDFLLGRDLSVADYPYTERVSSTWFKFGFPLSYVSNVLEALNVLAALGHGDDPRLRNAMEFVLSKQDDQGCWKVEYSLNGKMRADIEAKGQPSKWVTLQAVQALKWTFG
jgi:hypothetical protein